MNTTGARIKCIRKEVLGITQQELAVRLNVPHQNYISHYEQGGRQIELETLLQLAQLGKTSAHWLITGRHYRCCKHVGTQTQCKN